MCGIVGYKGKNNNAIKVVIEGLENLEYRGYDSAGIAYLKESKINIEKEAGRIKNLKDKLDLEDKSNLAIGHTRWATHGIPTRTNAHPHQVGKFTMVHNGIIENYLTLKEELLKNNYTFKSDTDTEIACAYLDYLYKQEKDILKSLQKLIQVIKGSYAFGIICEDDKDHLYALRSSSPLIIALGQDENYIASDVPAILKYTNKYLILENYEIAKISNDNVTIYNKDLQEVNKTINTYEGTYESSIKGNYEHFMLKEINEEPDTFEKTINSCIENNFKDIDLKKYTNIHIVACGSAYHAGLVGKYLIEKFANIKVYTQVASEYRYEKTFYDKNTLVILISQSGETADTLAALRKAKDNNIDTLSIVNVFASSIARESKYVIYTKAGCEIAVATTKAYLAQLTVLIALTLKLSNKQISKEEITKIKEQITNLIKKDDYKTIANKIYEAKNIFFIGRGIDYALCMEGSLKLKEISYISSVAYQAGELKHGTISLIEENTPVIAILTEEELIKKTISNIKEVKARGANTIIITNKNIQGDFYDEKITIPKTDELFQQLLTIIPLQLIAYEVAKLNNCDIDKPRNLAKSVTVE
jgi:glucosamine--fructose-6-phosphate aminotransferase (isomerizing)